MTVALDPFLRGFATEGAAFAFDATGARRRARATATTGSCSTLPLDAGREPPACADLTRVLVAIDDVAAGQPVGVPIDTGVRARIEALTLPCSPPTSSA